MDGWSIFYKIFPVHNLVFAMRPPNNDFFTKEKEITCTPRILSKILIAMFEYLALVHLYCILFSLCQPKKFRGPEMNNLHVIWAFFFVCNISLALQVRSVADDNRIGFFGLLCLIGWAQTSKFLLGCLLWLYFLVPWWAACMLFCRNLNPSDAKIWASAP